MANYCRAVTKSPRGTTLLFLYSFLNYVLSASRVCLSYSFLCLFLSFPTLTLPPFLKQAYVQILSVGSQDTVPSLGDLWLILLQTILPPPFLWCTIIQKNKIVASTKSRVCLWSKEHCVLSAPSVNLPEICASLSYSALPRNIFYFSLLCKEAREGQVNLKGAPCIPWLAKFQDMDSASLCLCIRLAFCRFS